MNLDEALEIAQLPAAKEPVARRLYEELGFSVEAAIAWGRSAGRCEYCRRDLIVDRFGYACGDVEHLLPKSNHPTVKYHPRNWLVACRLCNSAKDRHSVLDQGQDPEQALESESERERMIQKARDYIWVRRRDELDPAWNAAKTIIDP